MELEGEALAVVEEVLRLREDPEEERRRCDLTRSRTEEVFRTGGCGG